MGTLLALRLRLLDRIRPQVAELVHHFGPLFDELQIAVQIAFEESLEGKSIELHQALIKIEPDRRTQCPHQFEQDLLGAHQLIVALLEIASPLTSQFDQSALSKSNASVEKEHQQIILCRSLHLDLPVSLRRIHQLSPRRDALRRSIVA